MNTLARSRMNSASIESFTFHLIAYASYITLIFGNIGCICNFITFTAKQLRQNSCGWYLLMSSLFDFLFINFGLFTKLAAEHYGSSLRYRILVWCQLRIFLTWVLPCFSTGYLVLASIDRYLSTSKSARIRSFSQIKVAHQMTCVPIILYSLTGSHQFFYFNLRPACLPAPGTYAFFLSIYSIIWTNLIPQIAMFIFGLITYFNVRKSRQRVVHPNIQYRNRTDSQMIKMTLVQILFSFILVNLRTIYYSYTVLTTNMKKDDYRQAMETLILQISSFIFYLNFSKSFFVNTLSSNLFRKVFHERLLFFYRRMLWWKIPV
ncbi:unnamed protein product [Rotaria magnacalcarata]|uniref:G-protein coupled receptors family 1 profile domain-containing protein n=2 Tax=Rotaria magnacalcarata TaxID=392030 RepID=A0A816U8Y5_9BILA|nr:unnamed protein product [Rotaria magnacalcarata]CAF3852361.1 unnamed protein product [Rotaria magnacalcarata]CAF3896368.1 unnamed protein product [Rotaria magnacalcarata]